ncbi:MAG: CPP1-like family protein [Leptolyngbyaceae bacterium]|nr:CPP1-like family protein [Leptolyngbyaceae bacterium]
MSDQNPYDQLGVTEYASFDEIQDARDRMMQEHSSDLKSQQLIEAAYDAILMDRLRMRQEGRIKVPEGIRFPEKLAQPSPNVVTSARKSAPPWLERFLDTPNRSDILWSGLVFTGLSSLSLIYPAANGAGLQLALALGVVFSIYFIQRKEKKFGRALLLTLLGLIGGLLLGGVVSTFLHTTLVSLGLTDAGLATIVAFFVFWLITSFLR